MSDELIHVLRTDAVTDPSGVIKGTVVAPTMDPVAAKTAMGLSTIVADLAAVAAALGGKADATTLSNYLTTTVAQQLYGSLIDANTSVPGGNTVTNTGTEMSLSPAITIPAGALKPNDTLRLALAGYWTTTVLTVGTLTFRVKFNGVTKLTGTLNTLALASTNQSIAMVANAHIFDNGTANLQGTGQFYVNAGSPYGMSMVNTANSSIDWTVDQVITVTVQFSTAISTSSMTATQFAGYRNRRIT